MKIVYQNWWQYLDVVYAGDTPSAKNMKSMSLLTGFSITNHIFCVWIVLSFILEFICPFPKMDYKK